MGRDATAQVRRAVSGPVSTPRIIGIVSVVVGWWSSLARVSGVLGVVGHVVRGVSVPVSVSFSLGFHVGGGSGTGGFVIGGVRRVAAGIGSGYESGGVGFVVSFVSSLVRRTWRFCVAWEGGRRNKHS